jgi:hypothetical protein
MFVRQFDISSGYWLQREITDPTPERAAALRAAFGDNASDHAFPGVDMWSDAIAVDRAVDVLQRFAPDLLADR